MAADGIEVRIEDMRVRVLLERLQATMGNLYPAMDEIAGALRLRAEESFNRGVAPGGGKWQPWSPATAAFRRKKGKSRSGQILVYDGDLRSSLNHKATANSAIVGAGLRGAGEGGTWRYAAIHQFGGMAGRGRKVRIPARPYLFGADGKLPAAWMGAVKDILTDYLAGNV